MRDRKRGSVHSEENEEKCDRCSSFLTDLSDQRMLHLWEGDRGGGRLPIIGEYGVFSITHGDACPSGVSASSSDTQFPGWMGH